MKQLNKIIIYMTDIGAYLLLWRKKFPETTCVLHSVMLLFDRYPISISNSYSSVALRYIPQ